MSLSNEKKMRNRNNNKVLEDEECFEIVRKKLRQESMDEFTLISHEVVPIDEVNGYMGQYFILRATVASSKSPMDKRNMNFFTKIPPPENSPMYEFNRQTGTFKKEAAFYSSFFPEVLNGLDKRCIPECFLCIGDDVIVLEDMTHSGYLMTNKFVPFDFHHCAVMMKMLAKFHAKSLIFEEQNKKNLQEDFSHCMKESLWALKESRPKSMYDAAVKGAISLVDLIPGLNLESKLKFKDKIELLSVNHAEKLSPSVKHKNVLCHGDLWANNILFKYDSNQKPLECCLIDFQHARYNPPAHDVLSFLQYTTTRKLREEHSNALYQIYYESMSESLNHVGMEIEKIFPWNEFIKSLDEQKTICLTNGIFNLPIMLLEPSTANKYFSENPELLESALYDDRTPLVCGQFKEVPLYKERLSEVFLELHDHVV